MKPAGEAVTTVGEGIGMAERSPEKAGVGGSIPSLATFFSIAYKHSNLAVLFQLFQLQARRTSLME